MADDSDEAELADDSDEAGLAARIRALQAAGNIPLAEVFAVAWEARTNDYVENDPHLDEWTQIFLNHQVSNLNQLYATIDEWSTVAAAFESDTVWHRGVPGWFKLGFKTARVIRALEHLVRAKTVVVQADSRAAVDVQAERNEPPRKFSLGRLSIDDGTYCDSVQCFSPVPCFNHRVAVIFTGGTFGMTPKPDGSGRLGLNVGIDALHARLQEVLPESLRDSYQLYDTKPPLDSSAMAPEGWVRIAKKIQYLYTKFDGFVVLHGTDTLAYTAAALSFLIPGVNKPIVLTGSQKPIFVTNQSDAPGNISGALQAALWTHRIDGLGLAGVFVFFGSKLMLGTSVVKVHANDFDAFDCPKRTSAAAHVNSEGVLCIPPGLYAERKYHAERKSDGVKFHDIHPTKRAAILRLYPGVDLSFISTFVDQNIYCIVLQSLGAGNGPVEAAAFRGPLEDYMARGGCVVYVTECAGGAVTEAYDSGIAYEIEGIVPLRDMTVEAAYAKATVFLHRAAFVAEWRTKFCELMAQGLGGEIVASFGKNAIQGIPDQWWPSLTKYQTVRRVNSWGRALDEKENEPPRGAALRDPVAKRLPRSQPVPTRNRFEQVPVPTSNRFEQLEEE